MSIAPRPDRREREGKRRKFEGRGSAKIPVKRLEVLRWRIAVF